jgi:hypothetical protein
MKLEEISLFAGSTRADIRSLHSEGKVEVDHHDRRVSHSCHTFYRRRYLFLVFHRLSTFNTPFSLCFRYFLQHHCSF